MRFLGEWKIRPIGNKYLFKWVEVLYILGQEKEVSIAAMYNKLGCSKGLAVQVIKTNLQMGNIEIEGRYLKLTKRGYFFLREYADYINELVNKKVLK